MRPVARMKARGDQLLQRLTQGLRGGPAEHFLGRLVVKHDALCLVNADDSVHRRIQQGHQPCMFVLGLDARRHIAQDHGKQLAVGGIDLGDRCIDRKLFAAGTQGIDHRRAAHAPGGHAVLAKTRHEQAMLGTKPCWNQPLQRLTEHGGGGPAKDAFSGLVVDQDALARIDRDDGIHGREQDSRKPGRGVIGAAKGRKRRHEGGHNHAPNLPHWHAGRLFLFWRPERISMA